jgi:hypothetical protein
MRRIWTRGIGNANKFVLGAAIAYNLKKWLKWQDINKCSTKISTDKLKKEPTQRIPDLLNTFVTFLSPQEQFLLKLPQFN